MQQDRAAILRRIRERVGAGGWTDDRREMQPYLSEWRGRFEGRCSMLVRPRNTAEVAAVVRLCSEAGIGIVPQGGNTGLCGGAIPRNEGEILLSLERMNRILAVDAVGYALTAEAGCVLAELQAAARAANRLFALSLAAEGSCQAGGAVSTNAGGSNVLRYGTAREQVLGLEVVLPDGRVLDTLRAVRKDTGGYDLKQWFIGAEGTLGIVTRVCWRLFPQPAGSETAIAAVADPEAALSLLAALRDALGDNLTAFELIPRRGVELVLKHIPGTTDPLDRAWPWYVLVEHSTAARGGSDSSELTEALGLLLESGRIADAAVAASGAQREALWRLRDSLSAAQKREGPSIKHDVAVPLGAMAEFIARASERIRELLPGAPVLAFGHVGDGNVHFNVGRPEDLPAARLLARWDDIAARVHDVAVSLGGTFSAEHGVGVLKAAELTRLRAPLELELMRGLKRLLDPKGIMNPGKLLASDPALPADGQDAGRPDSTTDW